MYLFSHRTHVRYWAHHKKWEPCGSRKLANLQFASPVLLKNLDSTAVRRETKMNRVKVGLEAESLKPDA